MGKIKKILENELTGGNQSTEVYPVTSIKAVYDENNERLDNIIDRKDNEIQKELETEVARATNAENNLRDTINNITKVNENATTANIVTIDTIPNTSSSNVQQALNELFKNATFAGIATPTTNPGTPDGPVFYLATEAGTYSNFNGISVAVEEAAILQWNDGAWTKKVTGFANQKAVNDKLSDLSSIFSNEVCRIQQNIHGLDKTISISEFKIGWNEISSFAAIANVTYNIIISLDVVISGGVYVRIKENEAVKQTLEIKSIKNISFVCDKPSNISIEYNKYAIDLSNNSMLTNIKCNATIPTMSEFNDNIDSIKSTIEDVNNTTVDKTGGKYTLTSIESKFEGKYISIDGKVYNSSPYFISNSITLHKDDKIEAHINVIHDNVVSVISKRISEDNYEVLSIGHIDQDVYTFVATEDCEVVLCYRTISSISIDRFGTINRKINDLIVKRHHILHVGKDEEYKTINSACSDAINGDVIIVHEGTYNESVNISACDTTEDHKTVQNLSHFKDIAIIGVDKEKCILQNDLGLYASPPLWMTNGLLKNMTIKSLHTNNSRNNISYAIHIDGAIYSNGCKTPLTVDNCTVYSENSNSLGCGIDDVDIIVTNSEIQSTSLGTYPMAVHNSPHCRANGSKVKLKNNIFKGSYKTCLWFNKMSSTSEEDKFEVLAIGNILQSNYEYKASDLTQNDNIANMSELNAFNRGSLILGE